MAIPSYTTDLTIFDDGANSTSWVEMTNMAVGGGPSDETDLAIYGTTCVSQQSRKTGLASMCYNNGAAVTINTDEGFFVWAKYFAPNGLETLAAGGVQVVIGSSTTNWGAYYVDGSDTYAYGGWINYFVDPTLTEDNSNGTYGTSYQYVGAGINIITATSKGNPHTTDILRYGRGEARFTGGESANYATFDGYALVNDNPTTGRFGLFQDQGGAYLWKGLMSLGLTGTLVDMRDSNVNITIDDTIKAAPSFNRIEVHNVSSNVEWTAINITKVGTVSKGEFEMIDNATVLMDTCVFSDMSTFIFSTGATLTNSSFIRDELVTQDGATITSCTFDASVATAALLSNDLDSVTDCSFFSGATGGHAVEMNTIGDGSVSWGNNLDGYVAGAAGSPATTGDTGNEAIFVNVASGTLDINVTAGYSVPSIRTAGVIVNVIAGAVTTNVTVQDIDDSTFVNAARVIVQAFSGGSENWLDTVSIVNAVTTATVTHTAHGLSTTDKVNITGADLDEYNGVKTITVSDGNTYTYTTTGTPTSPAAGTPVSTTVYIDGETNISGLISFTRTFSTNQPIRGRVRRATSGALYKTSPINSTIDSANGLNLGVLLISDE